MLKSSILFIYVISTEMLNSTLKSEAGTLQVLTSVQARPGEALAAPRKASRLAPAITVPQLSRKGVVMTK